MQNNLGFIRRKFEEDEFRLTSHCIERMDERSVSTGDVRNAGSTGTVIEVTKIDSKERYAIEGFDEEGHPFYLVVVKEKPFPVVITVCRFWEEVWALEEGRHTRCKR